jgi:uncharacterized protein DUF3105
VAKPAKTERQKVIDDIRKQQKSADKRQGYLIVGVCVAIAVLIVGAAIYRPVKDSLDMRAYNDKSLSEIGGPASACEDITTKPANGSGEHVPDGTEVKYDDAPPAFGSHWNNASAPATMSRKVWKEDRPDLEVLVHNLEHGFTIVWYDETIADDDGALTELEAVGKKFPGTTNMRYKFYAAPWTSDDEKESGKFPDGQHIAITHWSAGGAGETDTAKQKGVWQYCSEFSGEALDDFMIEYPYLDSPEPDAMSQEDL